MSGPVSDAEPYTNLPRTPCIALTSGGGLTRQLGLTRRTATHSAMAVTYAGKATNRVTTCNSSSNNSGRKATKHWKSGREALRRNQKPSKKHYYG